MSHRPKPRQQGVADQSGNHTYFRGHNCWYVIAHAEWRKKRGKKNPSATYGDLLNPRAALKAAMEDASTEVTMLYLAEEEFEDDLYWEEEEVF